MVVEKMTEVASDDGERRIKMYGMKEGSEVEYLFSEELCVGGRVLAYQLADDSGNLVNYYLEEGDAIRIALNSSGDISKLECIYDKSRNMAIATSTDIILTDVKRKEDVILLTSSSEMYSGDKFKIVVYDGSKAQGKRARTGVIDDIIENNGLNSIYSRVLIQTRYSEPKAMIIYNLY